MPDYRGGRRNVSREKGLHFQISSSRPRIHRMIPSDTLGDCR